MQIFQICVYFLVYFCVYFFYTIVSPVFFSWKFPRMKWCNARGLYCISEIPRFWCLHVSWSPINNDWMKHVEVNVNRALQFELWLTIIGHDIYAISRSWNNSSSLLTAAVLLQTGWIFIHYFTDWKVARWSYDGSGAFWRARQCNGGKVRAIHHLFWNCSP